MGIRGKVRDGLNGVLRSYGFEAVPIDALYDWQRGIAPAAGNNDTQPAGAADYLKPDNPRLLELQRRYAAFDPAATTPSVWSSEYVQANDIAQFRGDNGWVWQIRGRNVNRLAYALTYYYLKSIDSLGLFDTLTEDENFGNHVFAIDGRLISRDLLDSVGEMYFLNRHLTQQECDGLRVLDIGAGYGRLAARMASAFPGIEGYYCTDAVAVSTFVCEYYLRFRDARRAMVIPLDEIENTLRERRIDLAVNVHSFSECRMEAIEWWVGLLARHRVKKLMIVPNRATADGQRLLTNDGQDFLPLLERYGYRTIVREPTYLDSIVQEFGIEPSWRHLLELAD